MSPTEVTAKMRDSALTFKADALAIISFVRSLPSTLRDAGREHAAKELEQLLFIYDAHQEETDAWIKANGLQILEALKKGFEERGL